MKAWADRQAHQQVLKVQPFEMATCSGVGFMDKVQGTQEVFQVEEMVDLPSEMVPLGEVELVPRAILLGILVGTLLRILRLAGIRWLTWKNA